jgi:hypothetical protein
MAGTKNYFGFLILFFFGVLWVVYIHPSLGLSKTTSKRSQLRLSQPGEMGIFDPSLEWDGHTQTLWMSYSSARANPNPIADAARIAIRLAYSKDRGKTWKDISYSIFEPSDISLPKRPPHDQGIWQYEVSSLVHDPGAPQREQWKVFAFRYLKISAGRVNEHSWIALKTASSPSGPWSKERKLFTGFIYNKGSDPFLGPPEIRLHDFHRDLKSCAAFTEPGALAKKDALYLSLSCETGKSKKNKIILLKLSQPSGTWSYRGTFLSYPQAKEKGFEKFTASDMFSVGNKDYLMVSPENKKGLYKGCRVFAIDDLENAKLETKMGGLLLQTEVPDSGGELNGACTYDSAAVQTGILSFERYDPRKEMPFLRIFKTHISI